MADGKPWSAVKTNSSTLPEGLVIREFNFPSDYEPVIWLWKNAGSGIHLRRSDEPEEIAKKLKRDPDLFILAELSGRIIGAVLGGFDGRRGMVYHLAVEQSFRKKGVGTALMSELEQRLMAKGCQRTYLLVTHENGEAIKYYQDEGWEQMDLRIYAKDLG